MKFHVVQVKTFAKRPQVLGSTTILAPNERAAIRLGVEAIRARYELAPSVALVGEIALPLAA